MSTGTKRLPLNKAQSVGGQFINSSSNLDKSGFLESIKEDSHLFAGLATDKPEDVSIPRPQIRASTGSNFHPNTLLRSNPPQVQMNDEITKLKRKQKILEQTIDKLRQQNKDNNRPNLTKKEAEQLMELRRQNKELNRSLFQAKSNARGQSQKRMVNTMEKQKIADLLKVIDRYKAQAFSAEDQLKRYQEGEYSNQGNQVGNNYSGKKQRSNQALSSSHHYLNQLSVIKQRPQSYQSPSMNIEMNRLREQNVFLQSQISKMNAQMMTANLMQDQMYQLKLQKQRLQSKLIKMAQNPIFGRMNERLEDETKMKALEDKVKMYNERCQREKEKVIRLETELKMTQIQLVDSSKQAQDHETENVRLRARIKEHPIIDIIMRDEVMLQQVIGYLQVQNYQSDILGAADKSNPRYMKDNPMVRIETLISENELLALQLTKNQQMLRTIKQIYEEHEKIRQLEQRKFAQVIEQKDKRINQLAVLSGQKDKMEVMKNGIKYEDDVSMFSHDERVVQESGINYFDIYLAEINLVDMFVRQQVKIADVSKIMNFMTVDFYNHKTQNTKVASGLRHNINSEFSFKVVEDECLFNFFEKGEVSLNVWTTNGGKTILLGEAKISLKPMVTNAMSIIAPVVRSSVPLYFQNKSIGSLSFVMRLRYPVYKALSQLKSSLIQSIGDHASTNYTAYQNKQLVVIVQAAQGLPLNVNSFVYFTIEKDYCTDPFPGTHPIYNHTSIISINYSPQFQQYLKRGDLEFTVLDDNAPTEQDLIGTCKVNLSKLLFADGRIGGAFKIINKNGETKGDLRIKIFWSGNLHMERINTTIQEPKDLFEGSFGANYDLANALSLNMNRASTGNFPNPQSIMPSGHIDITSRQSNNFDITSRLSNNFNQLLTQKATTPQDINQMLKGSLQSYKMDDLYKKFDNNGTGVISKIELKQGLASILGLSLTEAEFDNYWQSLQKPITQQSLEISLGYSLPNFSDPSQVRKQLAATNNSSFRNNSSTYTAEDLHNILREYMSQKNLSSKDLFLKFDANTTAILSKAQLKEGLFKLFSIKLSQQQLETYFRSFKQPISFQNFDKVFGKALPSPSSNDNRSNQESLRSINNLVRQNTSLLKKVTLQEYLKDKDLFTVSLDIDRDNSGTITRKELLLYLEEKGLTTNEVIEDKLSVMEFLKKHTEQGNIYESMKIQIPRTQSFIVSQDGRRR